MSPYRKNISNILVQQLDIHFNSKAGRTISLYLYLYLPIQGFDILS